MAVEAKHAFGRRTGSRRRELLERAAIVVGALVLVAGVVVFLQTRADSKLETTVAPAQKAPVQTAPAVKPGGKLDASARKTAVAFIRAGLARENLETAWNLATPALRQGVTKQQWLRGEMPFPPFPVANLETTGFSVLGTTPKEILLEILLVPKPDSDYVPIRYELTLERKSSKAPWKVSYFNPYAPPGIFAEPK